MKSKKVLITGVSGFIGRNVARALLAKDVELVGIVRPKTDSLKLSEFNQKMRFVEIDLEDIPALKSFLTNNTFDVILHIGALRGGRKYPEAAYYRANVDSTEQFATFAKDTNAVLIFCSSVGVYGAIPNELPATVKTEFQNDNYYHYTKIVAECIIQNLVLKGLQAIIVRPAITYGIGDYGFPYTLTKLIHRKLFIMPDTPVRINMANIDILKEVFVRLTFEDYTKSKVYNVADAEPVELKVLTDFISKKLFGKPYPKNRIFPVSIFRKAEGLACRLGLKHFQNQLKLISYSWYYDTEDLYKNFNLPKVKTIPSFKTVVNWYKERT